MHHRTTENLKVWNSNPGRQHPAHLLLALRPAAFCGLDFTAPHDGADKHEFTCGLRWLCSSHLPVSSVQSLSRVWLCDHGLQHARPPCPSPTPGVYPNSCPLSLWCHPTISSSVVPFSSHLQSFPASWSFQMSQFFASGGQSIEFPLQHQPFHWIFRTAFL